MKTFLILFLCLISLLGCDREKVQNINEIENGFKNIPDSVKLWTYWYWMNDYVSKEGITKDLESMSEMGISTAFIGNIGDKEFMKSGDVRMLSDEWWELMRWAIIEGKRTGVDIGIFNGPGWSQSGGPWITPDKSARYLVSTEIRVKGPIKIKKEIPAPTESFQDVALLAYRVPDGENVLVSALSPQLTSKPSIPGISNISDGRRDTKVALPNFEQTGTSYTIDFNLKQPFTANSVLIYTTEEPILADCELYVELNNEYKLVKRFKLDRQNESINVGAIPYAPIALSLPSVSTAKFRLVLKYIKDRRNNILAGGIREIEISLAERLEYYMEKQLAKLHQTPIYSGSEYQWETQEEIKSKSFAIDQKEIIDLSGRLDENGFLNWDVPEGEWIVQRTGMAPTGIKNHPVLPHAQGLEVDKMNKAAIQYHFKNYLGKIIEKLPDSAKSAFTHVIIDSYETGAQNWTDDLHTEFINRYNYDPLPWLPVLTGRIVESAEQSERFLWDLRRLISDLIAENYVGGLKEISHKYGAKLWLENYGHWGFPGESLLYGGYSDFVAGEFWNEGPLGNWECKIASSSAHIYGKNMVSAESFTTAGRHYERFPGSFKKRGDWSYTEGINQTVLTLFIHQPYENKKPGVNAWFGSEINRNNTWFSLSKPWMDYQRRCNFLLQQGNYVADVCYFYGEDAPKSNGVQNPPLPAGYSFDFINYDVIMNRLDVKDGKFILPDGMSYRVMVLPESETMRPELLEKISLLVEKGGVILGNAPEKSSSMKDYPVCDEKIINMAKKLWPNSSGIASVQNKYGKGKVFCNMSLEEVFEAMNISPDFYAESDIPVRWIHRGMPGMEVYFLTNQENQEISFAGNFRVDGMQPEWWNAIDGSIRALPEFEIKNGRTIIPLELEPFESGFVVFKKKANQTSTKSNFPKYHTVFSFSSPWEVTFTDPFQKSFNLSFLQLTDWRKSEDERIKYFSGTAVYETSFAVGDELMNEKVWINLGRVMTVAKVTLNGREVGGLWTQPWRLNISDYLKEGENILQVEIANNWVNKMIGDARLKMEERETWLSLNQFKPDMNLQASGLLGPVTLETR